MIRQDFSRVDPKRRANVNHKRKQFAEAEYKGQQYSNRLNFYILPPTDDITLEEFEEWAINRLKVLSELETCTFRNRTPEETGAYMAPLLQKYLPLDSNSSRSSERDLQRKKDHYSHFILRLAFSATEDLRRRFSRLETMLFKLRFRDTGAAERRDFVEGLGELAGLQWERIGEEERRELGEELVSAAVGGMPRVEARKVEEEGWFKVEWERVPELVEARKVLLKRGMAYVPVREQMSLVVAEFTRRLDQALEYTSRALPRLDEDDRLTPILAHLSQSFTAPSATYDSASAADMGGSFAPNHANIDALVPHMPLCMSTLHSTLRANAHLKHFGRLQYTLFLKGIGLSLDECILFWRRGFRLLTDDKFHKEYKYNIRHAYGDVGGDANRRGRGYAPFSCQKLLTEPPPGPGQAHGCPYRTHAPDRLAAALQAAGVADAELLKAVRDDVGRGRFNNACNRVFESQHRREIERAKREAGWGGAELDTILHPNDWFRRSWMLKHLGDGPAGPAAGGKTGGADSAYGSSPPDGVA